MMGRSRGVTSDGAPDLQEKVVKSFLPKPRCASVIQTEVPERCHYRQRGTRSWDGPAKTVPPPFQPRYAPSMPTPPRHTTLVVLASAVALLLTGCGSDDSDNSDGAAPKKSPTPTRSATPPSKTPSSPPPPATSPSLPKAADGTNLDACGDGTCEVEVKTGDVISVKSSSGAKEFMITDLNEGGATVAVGPFDNPMTTTVNGGVEINGVSLEITPLNSKRAIAKVS